jgi:hypothetical protein
MLEPFDFHRGQNLFPRADGSAKEIRRRNTEMPKNAQSHVVTFTLGPIRERQLEVRNGSLAVFLVNSKGYLAQLGTPALDFAYVFVQKEPLTQRDCQDRDFVESGVRLLAQGL